MKYLLNEKDNERTLLTTDLSMYNLEVVKTVLYLGLDLIIMLQII